MEFRGETERWTPEDVQHLEEELFRTLKELREIEGENKAEQKDSPPLTDVTNARVVQVLDSKDLNLLFAYPRDRLSTLLRGDADKVWDMHDLYATLLPPEDYRKFRDELGRLRERKEGGAAKDRRSRPVAVQSLPDNCTSGLFYMQHRMMTLENYPTPLPPTSDSFEHVETVVVPYGAVTFVCMQRRNTNPAGASAATATQQVAERPKAADAIPPAPPAKTWEGGRFDSTTDGAHSLPPPSYTSSQTHPTPTPPAQTRPMPDHPFFDPEAAPDEYPNVKRRRLDEPSLLLSGSSSHLGFGHGDSMDARLRREEFLHPKAAPSAFAGSDPSTPWYHQGAMDPFEGALPPAPASPRSGYSGEFPPHTSDEAPPPSRFRPSRGYPGQIPPDAYYSTRPMKQQPSHFNFGPYAPPPAPHTYSPFHGHVNRPPVPPPAEWESATAPPPQPRPRGAGIDPNQRRMDAQSYYYARPPPAHEQEYIYRRMYPPEPYDYYMYGPPPYAGGRSAGGGNGGAPREGRGSVSEREGKTTVPGGRPKGGDRPRKCESCQTEESPEWRKGPSGQKTLCNACGLRYSRSVAKQKNLGPAGMVVAPPPPPPSGPPPPHPALRGGPPGPMSAGYPPMERGFLPPRGEDDGYGAWVERGGGGNGGGGWGVGPGSAEGGHAKVE
ncbi:hypothetical protein HDV00_004900 [Rhizophlyctis rosea]|nr:hypothetical protein HDV00_004900 [Rhizophlyctis rosea]